MNNYAKIDYRAVGERIRQLRTNESQGDFAKKFGLSQVDVSRVERGEVKPTPEFLYNLCITYSINYSWLLAGEGPMNIEPRIATVRTEDSNLADTIEKLAIIWDKGDFNEKAHLLGTIEVLYKEIQKKSVQKIER